MGVGNCRCSWASQHTTYAARLKTPPRLIGHRTLVTFPPPEPPLVYLEPGLLRRPRPAATNTRALQPNTQTAHSLCSSRLGLSPAATNTRTLQPNTQTAHSVFAPHVYLSPRDVDGTLFALSSLHSVHASPVSPPPLGIPLATLTSPPRAPRPRNRQTRQTRRCPPKKIIQMGVGLHTILPLPILYVQ